MNFINYIASACLLGAAVGTFYLIAAGICKFINFLTKGKLEDILINLLFGDE